MEDRTAHITILTIELVRKRIAARSRWIRWNKPHKLHSIASPSQHVLPTLHSFYIMSFLIKHDDTVKVQYVGQCLFKEVAKIDDEIRDDEPLKRSFGWFGIDI